MKYIIIQITVVVLLFSSFSAKAERGILSLGVGVGYSYVPGVYSDIINDSFIISIYSIPYSYKWFYVDTEFSFSMYPLIDSSKSNDTLFRLSVGPGILFPVMDFLQIFLSINFQSVFINLYTYSDNISRVTFKPGLSIKTGAAFPVYKWLRLKITAEFSYFDLSSKAFLNLNFSGGIAYDFNFNKREGEDKKKKLIFDKKKVETETEASLYKLIIKADEEYTKKKLINADKLYRKILVIDPRNKVALIRSKKIKRIFSIYNDARKYERVNRLFLALQLYISIESSFPNAKVSLYRLRKKMYKQIYGLEKKAVAAYNKKEYKLSIYYLKQISYIDPNNNIVRIYLSRAIKRYNIIKKFK